MDFANIDANQYFDFTKVDCVHAADDSYFDKHADTETSISVVSSSTTAGTIDEQRVIGPVENILPNKNRQKKSRPVFQFSAVASTSHKGNAVKGGKLSSVQAKNTAKGSKSKRLSNGRQQHLKQKHSAAVSKIVPKKTVPARSAKQNIQPIHKPAVSGTAVKRTVPFLPLRPPKIKKSTHPTTPECLKRSQNKGAKVGKTSEEIELEHIAELQKQTIMLLKANKDTMKKKAFAGSALKPISMPVENKSDAKKNVKKSLQFGGVSKFKPIGKDNAKREESKSFGRDFQSSFKFTTPLRTSTPYGLRKSATAEGGLPVAIPKCPLAPPSKSHRLPSSHTGLYFIQKQARTKVESALSSEKSGNTRKIQNVHAELEIKETSMCQPLRKVSVVLEKLSEKDLHNYMSPSGKAQSPKSGRKTRKSVKESEKENKMSSHQPIAELSAKREKITFEDKNAPMRSTGAIPKKTDKKAQKKEKTPKKQLEDFKKLEVRKKQFSLQVTNKTRSLNKPLTDITSSFPSQQQVPMARSIIKRSGTEIEVKPKSLRSKNNDENFSKNANFVQRVTRSKSYNTIEPSTSKAVKNTVPTAKKYLTKKWN